MCSIFNMVEGVILTKCKISNMEENKILAIDYLYFTLIIDLDFLY